MPPPAILGHEGAGIVDWVGSEVRGLQVGDRVIGSFIPACGALLVLPARRVEPVREHLHRHDEPAHTRGDGTALNTMTGLGTFADMMTVDEMSVVKVETELPDEYLALIGQVGMAQRMEAVAPPGGVMLSAQQAAGGHRCVLGAVGPRSRTRSRAMRTSRPSTLQAGFGATGASLTRSS